MRAVRLLLRPFKPLALHLRAFLAIPIREEVMAMERSLVGRIRELEADVAAHTRHLEAVALAQGAAVRREGAARLDAAASAIGGRFDEFEYKVRPLIPFDETAWAVRLGDGYVLAPKTEPMLLVMLADATSGGLEPGTRRLLRALLDPGMQAADVGASIGLLTLACARAVGPTGKVWSFEPEPPYNALLRKTLTLNGLRWVDLAQKAVGAAAGRLTFHVSAIPGHSSLYPLPAEENARPIEVEVVRLDDVIPPGGKLDLAKIDVEGAELDVLAGMKRVIEENRELAIVTEYGPVHLKRVGIAPADWFAAFEAHGLRAYAIEDPAGRCRRVKPADLEDVESVNLVWVRPGSRAAGRLPK